MSAEIGTHPNADKSVVFSGFAALTPKPESLVQWGYNPRPIGPKDVELDVSHCGICGSDIHQMDCGWGERLFPMVPGHEVVGTITAIGSEVSTLKVGDRVGIGAQCLSCLDKTGCADCGNGDENHCTKGAVYTYNSQYADKQRAYGGYINRVRAHEAFTFLIPSNIPSHVAAPLLCAGATVYSPLARYVKPGMNVAVIGIGGLGHLAVQFAAKMGAKVTAVSSSESKRADSEKLGATGYINSSKPEQIQAARRSFDVIVLAANHGTKEMLNDYLMMTKTHGYFVLVALPEEPLQIEVFTLVGNGIHLTGSSIASRQELSDMLAFASKHNVLPWVQVMPIAEVNEAIKKVRANEMRFRIVLEHRKE